MMRNVRTAHPVVVSSYGLPDMLRGVKVTILFGKVRETMSDSETMSVDIRLDNPLDSDGDPPRKLYGSFLGSGPKKPHELDELWPRTFSVKLPQFDVWYDGESTGNKFILTIQ